MPRFHLAMMGFLTKFIGYRFIFKSYVLHIHMYPSIHPSIQCCQIWSISLSLYISLSLSLFVYIFIFIYIYIYIHSIDHVILCMHKELVHCSMNIYVLRQPHWNNSYIYIYGIEIIHNIYIYINTMIQNMCIYIYIHIWSYIMHCNSIWQNININMQI